MSDSSNRPATCSASGSVPRTQKPASRHPAGHSTGALTDAVPVAVWGKVPRSRSNTVPSGVVTVIPKRTGPGPTPRSPGGMPSGRLPGASTGSSAARKSESDQERSAESVPSSSMRLGATGGVSAVELGPGNGVPDLGELGRARQQGRHGRRVDGRTTTTGVARDRWSSGSASTAAASVDGSVESVSSTTGAPVSSSARAARFWAPTTTELAAKVARAVAVVMTTSTWRSAGRRASERAAIPLESRPPASARRPARVASRRSAAAPSRPTARARSRGISSADGPWTSPVSRPSTAMDATTTTTTSSTPSPRVAAGGTRRRREAIGSRSTGRAAR